MLPCSLQQALWVAVTRNGLEAEIQLRFRAEAARVGNPERGSDPAVPQLSLLLDRPVSEAMDANDYRCHWQLENGPLDNSGSIL